MSDTTAVAGHPAEPIGARLAAVFLPAPLPREGRIAFGFAYEQTTTAIPLIIKEILAHRDEQAG